MNKTEIIDLLIKIKRRFPSYRVPDEPEPLQEMVDDLHGDLADVPMDTALENLRRYVRSGKPFAPTIAELARPLEPEKTEQDYWHEKMRQSAREYLAEFEEMQKNAAPPPEEIRRIMRPPDNERWEALREYAKQLERVTARH
ncbi:hypothetical protein LJK87_49895 [Paenibacillus sp. P25]|nr:hypothetical protein LJK87_49895 [Paenibacillus sp. P25]